MAECDATLSGRHVFNGGPGPMRCRCGEWPPVELREQLRRFVREEARAEYEYRRSLVRE